MGQTSSLLLIFLFPPSPLFSHNHGAEPATSQPLISFPPRLVLGALPITHQDKGGWIFLPLYPTLVANSWSIPGSLALLQGYVYLGLEKDLVLPKPGGTPSGMAAQRNSDSLSWSLLPSSILSLKQWRRRREQHPARMSGSE